MRPALKAALIFSVSWILLKFLFLYLGIFQNEIFYSGLLNNFFLLAAIALGLYLEKKKEGFGEGTALSDIKNAMIAGAPYALIVSVFMYFYYQDINPDFVENRVTERMDLVYNSMQRDTYVDSLKMQNKDFKVMTDEEIYKQIYQETESAFSPKSLLTFSLLGLLILGFTYSILITAIYRKVLFRDYYSKSE
ncbi:MAG: DUF4199 domain-containing protein [Brumimicrobium sp.]|nr:DUF4199 domain-containing protein [Brumimicrobium sp.]